MLLAAVSVAALTPLLGNECLHKATVPPRAALPSRARTPRMQTFEAQLAFDPAQLAVFTVALSAPVAYWWFITVPEARLNLAKDKRLEGGDTKQYLEELRDSPDERPLERWFFDKWLRQLRPSKAPRPAPEASAEDASAPVPAPAPTLGELFAPASLAGNATPKFFSGDNPIVVTVGALLALGTLAAGARQGGAAGAAADAAVVAATLAFGTSRLTLK